MFRHEISRIIRVLCIVVAAFIGVWVAFILTAVVVRAVEPKTLTPEVFTTGLSYPFGLVFDHEGNLFVSCRKAPAEPVKWDDEIPGMIVKIRPNRTVETTADTLPHPGSLVVDNQCSLWVVSLGVNGYMDVLPTTLEKVTKCQLAKYITRFATEAGPSQQALGVKIKENKVYTIVYKRLRVGIHAWDYRDVLTLYSGSTTTSGSLDIKELGVALYGPIESVMEPIRYATEPIALSINAEGEIFIADNAMGPAIFRLSQKAPYAYGFTKKIWDMTFDAAGNLYVSGSDHDKPRVGLSKGDVAGHGTIYKVAPGGGKGSPLLTSLHYPTGLAIHDGWLYIADYADGKILRVKINAQPAQGW